MLPDEVYRELREGNHAKLYHAERHQRDAARVNGTRRVMEAEGESMGEVKFQVRPEFYHYWGNRLGYECWDDHNGFVREFLRDNPECRIDSRSQKIQVGPGSLDRSPRFWRPPICGTKFRKTYGGAAA